MSPCRQVQREDHGWSRSNQPAGTARGRAATAAQGLPLWKWRRISQTWAVLPEPKGKQREVLALPGLGHTVGARHRRLGQDDDGNPPRRDSRRPTDVQPRKGPTVHLQPGAPGVYEPLAAVGSERRGVRELSPVRPRLPGRPRENGSEVGLRRQSAPEFRGDGRWPTCGRERTAMLARCLSGRPGSSPTRSGSSTYTASIWTATSGPIGLGAAPGSRATSVHSCGRSEEYARVRADAGFLYDWDDIAGAVVAELQGDDRQGLYRHIVIDEGQDFSPAMLRSLAAAIPPEGSLTFFGDMAQQIYGRHVSWKQAGLRCPTASGSSSATTAIPRRSPSWGWRSRRCRSSATSLTWSSRTSSSPPGPRRPWWLRQRERRSANS